MTDEKQIIEDMARAMLAEDFADCEQSFADTMMEVYLVSARAAFAVCKAALSLDGLSERKESEDHIADAGNMVASAPAPVQAGMIWQPVETAPKDGTRFIAWDDVFDCALHTMKWNGANFVTETEQWSGRFSRWMPPLASPAAIPGDRK